MSFNVVFPLFANVTQLDFTAPAQVFSRMPDAQVHVATAALEPVPTDSGFSICPTTTFADCPAVDLLCIPGGAGVFEALADRDMLDFVKQQSKAIESDHEKTNE